MLLLQYKTNNIKGIKDKKGAAKPPLWRSKTIAFTEQNLLFYLSKPLLLKNGNKIFGFSMLFLLFHGNISSFFKC
ncbi:hypothetical protein CTM62_07580 [Prevotella intermedia]|uniref:Uncharacterized protein n=1 Tax=Prevotella intermedia TaxID=28131 RepID=A0A2D3L7N5_PREIN|nr:hypothetical protein CTM62_07580 [Prevotella intermedia]